MKIDKELVLSLAYLNSSETEEAVKNFTREDKDKILKLYQEMIINGEIEFEKLKTN